jgi:hypothetical protein
VIAELKIPHKRWNVGSNKSSRTHLKSTELEKCKGEIRVTDNELRRTTSDKWEFQRETEV